MGPKSMNGRILKGRSRNTESGYSRKHYGIEEVIRLINVMGSIEANNRCGSIKS